MSFPQNEFNSFVVGAEDGYLYLINRHGTATNQVFEQQIFEGEDRDMINMSK